MTTTAEILGAWTVGDTGRPITGRLLLDESPVPLDTAASVEAWVLRPDRTTFHNSASTLLMNGVGEWSMSLKTGDLTVPGTYLMEIRIVWGDDTIQTFGPDNFPVRARFGP